MENLNYDIVFSVLKLALIDLFCDDGKNFLSSYVFFFGAKEESNYFVFSKGNPVAPYMLLTKLQLGDFNVKIC